MKVLDYIFLSIYRLLKYINSNPGYSEFIYVHNAIAGFIIFFIYLTVVNIFQIVNISLYIEIKIFLYCLLVIMYLASLYDLYYRKRYVKVLEEFKNESKRQKVIRSLLVLALFVLNIIFLFT